jgi:hypothetical protein
LEVGLFLLLHIKCKHLDGQVASAVQFLGTLSPVLSVVAQVAFSYEEHRQSSEWYNNVDRRQWRDLLFIFVGMAHASALELEAAMNVMCLLQSAEDIPHPHE